MNQELEKNLFNKFPNLYRDHLLSEQESPLAFGIECNDGWFDIIYTLSNSIQSRLEWTNRLFPDLNLSVKVSQVKEKWGTLRYYTDFSYKDSPTIDEMKQINRFIDTVGGMISLAESLSSKVCDSCGGKGTLNKGPWYRTTCSSCLDNHCSSKSNQQEYGGMPSIPDQVEKQ